MITLEQARQYFPADQCPSDTDLERALAFFYWLGSREYERIKDEMNHVQKTTPKE